MNNRDRLIEVLQAEGERIVPGRSRKYVQMTRSRRGARGYYWIGAKGALRVGETVSDSIPLPQLAKLLLAQGPRSKDADAVPADMALRMANARGGHRAS